MTQVGIYGEIQPEPLGNPLGSALRISLVLRLYFTVYPSSRHNTDSPISMKPHSILCCILACLMLNETAEAIYSVISFLVYFSYYDLTMHRR